MKEASPRTIHLHDYRPPAWRIERVELYFRLHEGHTEVTSTLQLVRNPEHHPPARDLRLDGEGLALLSLALDGSPLPADRYRQDESGLTIFDFPDRATLRSTVRIHPEQNTALEGLYRSSGNYCTQCEAEGFRRITFFLDRPDVLAVFTTTIEADRARYPVLLSNGNPVASGTAEGGRHWVRWHDPYPKPCYLFALVAGDLAVTEDRFVTRSGREVALRIYTEPHNADRTAHAMRSLRRAMAWDEQRYGLEYDLDIYMIVAVDDFNMGAMENKGLNIFNSKFVLARPDTATDTDYVNIEAVIAHEYFHNWTGNRVTCRDWFQLSLKEGLTVFRDQSFTADMTSPAVKRIDDVRALRTYQFAEDASPMAHPVRPQSYIEINNFYTVTVYEKGAEVVRLYETLLGRDGFRRGMDLYFQRHDGQAVTVEDFRDAMADANGRDLSLMQRWYDQAGTPELHVRDTWDAARGHYTLHFRQSCPPTPGQPEKLPFLIPVRLGLLDGQGRALPLQLAGEPAPAGEERVLELTEAEQSFTFVGLAERPLPSLLRGFSAPVRLHFDYRDEELAFLMAHDRDDFNRWDAGQQLAERLLLARIRAVREGGALPAAAVLQAAWQRLLADRAADPALVAEACTLPGESYLAELAEPIDPGAIHTAREGLRRELAAALREEWLAAYQRHAGDGTYRIEAADMGRRRLRNLALAALMTLSEADIEALAWQQFTTAGNMTDTIGALQPLVHSGSRYRAEALARFYERWQDDALVLDKWFSLQATAPLPDTLATVERLLDHPRFSRTNPNKVRALIGAFAQGNPVCFHAADGSGYRFVADQILALDPLNPQVAARLARVFTRWRHYEPGRAVSMRAELERIAGRSGLSRDVYEVVSRSLAAEEPAA